MLGEKAFGCRAGGAPQQFLILISETPDAAERSDCFQPIRARAARICTGVIIAAEYAVTDFLASIATISYKYTSEKLKCIY
jgi:hypothetical protein